MTAPERIWLLDYDLQDDDGEWVNRVEHSTTDPAPMSRDEYILHTRAALAASPLVQDIVAEAVDAAVKAAGRAMRECIEPACNPRAIIEACGEIRKDAAIRARCNVVCNEGHPCPCGPHGVCCGDAAIRARGEG